MRAAFPALKGMLPAKPRSRTPWILLAFILVIPIALAHARMTRSFPARAAELPQSPPRVELWFNELLDEEFNRIEVFPNADLKSTPRPNLTKGVPKVDPKDHTHLFIELPHLAPGEYYVEYRVLSRDGHSAPGRFSFKILGR